jgi:hypothetical protein
MYSSGTDGYREVGGAWFNKENPQLCDLQRSKNECAHFSATNAPSRLRF